MLQELAAIAFSDFGDLFDARDRLVPLVDLPPHVRAAVKTYTVRQVRHRTGRGGEGRTEVRQLFEVQMWPKMPALDALARHLGLYRRCPPCIVGQ
ncbi:MAG: hypothetical protein JWO38_1089 [Gemmataceae bacterium]|nr:hypothetical protein [Gemmataceae bacterium]